MEWEDYCRRLSDGLAGASLPEEKVEVAAEGLRAPFQVQPEEVSLFFFDPSLQALRFLWPSHLRQAGFIPLSSLHSPIVRAYLEKHPVINNHFASAVPRSLFRPLPERGGEPPRLIQKIICAPIGLEGAVWGVAQVCRKGADACAAGADFSPTDLRILSRVAEILERYVGDFSRILFGGAT